MTKKKIASVAREVLASPKTSRPDKGAKSVAASALTKRSQSKLSVTAKSGKIISRTVTTHRDALMRLANR